MNLIPQHPGHELAKMLEEKVERLIMKANNRGGTDNISVAYLVREEGDIE